MFNNHSQTILIGEIKLASPSEGILGRQEDIETRAVAYEHAGVDVISVVTKNKRFHGSTSFIPRIRKVTSLPILQKDFVVDPHQVYEAKMIGSDALLFIARIVNASSLRKLVALALSLGIEPVVEINNEKDLKKAIDTGTTCIAVNARDLRTFEVDMDRACAVLKKIPDRYIKLGFSGIHTSREVKKYKDAGAHGVLVGTALMKAENINAFVQELRDI